MKVTVIGAGAVGATCADNIARKELCNELVLLDIKEGVAEGKAQDMMQTATLLGFDTKIVGSTNDYSKTAGSDVVVITSGLPRKPGMTREELIGVNAGIVKSVCENVLKYSPDAIIIVISNPMDTMTYLAMQSTGLPKNRIIGMGGTLDSARFKYQLSQHLGCSPADLNAVVVGGHGDSADPFGYLEQHSRHQLPKRRTTRKSCEGHHGGRCYPDCIDRYFCLVCTRRRRCCTG
jgi:malate dehydrogenase